MTATDDDWLKVLRANTRDPSPQPAVEVEPVSKHALAAYARRLRQADRDLSRADAKKLAEKHERERRQGRNS